MSFFLARLQHMVVSLVASKQSRLGRLVTFLPGLVVTCIVRMKYVFLGMIFPVNVLLMQE